MKGERRTLLRSAIAILAFGAVVLAPMTSADAKRHRRNTRAADVGNAFLQNAGCADGNEIAQFDNRGTIYMIGEDLPDGDYFVDVTAQGGPDNGTLVGTSRPAAAATVTGGTGQFTTCLRVWDIVTKVGDDAGATGFNLASTGNYKITVTLTTDDKKDASKVAHTDSACEPDSDTEGGCDAPGTEGPPGDPTCSDEADNDGDELIDQKDPDCQEPEGPFGDPTCEDGVDNDGDDLIDSDDPDCAPPPPECSDEVDNDDAEDELVDAADPGCHTDGDPNNSDSYDPNDNDETDDAKPECSDEVDNNDAEDELVDAADPGCHTDGDPNNPESYDPNDPNEGNLPEGPPGDPTCSDGIDNDGDGAIDQADPGCQEPEGPQGDPTCSDGVDNDGDTLVDGADPDCQGPAPVTGPAGPTGPAQPGEPGQPGETNPCANPTISGTPLNDKIKGTKGDDIIDGLGGADLINGRGGNDIICGGTGNDKTRGGKGNDILFGEEGNDNVRGGKGIDTLDGGDGTDKCRVGKGKGPAAKNCETKGHVPRWTSPS